MVVDHPHRLHEGVADGRAAELEAFGLECFGHGAGFRRFGRHLGHAAPMVALGPAVDELPEIRREAARRCHQVEGGAGGQDGAFDLGAVADDAGILHQGLDLGGVVARDQRRVEAVEGALEIRALAQDGDPGEAGLEAVQDQLLEQLAVALDRHAPFLVVIGDIERVAAAPGAADERLSRHGRAPPPAARPRPRPAARRPGAPRPAAGAGGPAGSRSRCR